MPGLPVLTVSQSWWEFTFIASVMLPNHLILWHSLHLLPLIFPSIRDFSSESSVHIRWLKYWSFSLSISPSSEYSGLISLKIDWFDLAVQGTFRSLYQHHSLKAPILWHSAFFKIQFSHLYMTTGKKLNLWLYGPLSAKGCVCFLVHCLGLPQLSCQGASIISFHGCSHHLQWF